MISNDGLPSARRAGRALLLASVMSADEAELCARWGADIIDAKDPTSGALGGLPLPVVRSIVAVARRAGRPVSATIGDLDMEPGPVEAAVLDVAGCGVDFVKIGFHDGGDSRAVLDRLSAVDLGPVRPVGVLFADRRPDLSLIGAMARAGFAGVLLDTAGKASGSLTTAVQPRQLLEFVNAAHRSGMFSGLAGRLGIEDVSPLSATGTDILGFRSALCLDSNRVFAVDETLVQALRAKFDAEAPRAVVAAG